MVSISGSQIVPSELKKKPIATIKVSIAHFNFEERRTTNIVKMFVTNPNTTMKMRTVANIPTSILLKGYLNTI